MNTEYMNYGGIRLGVIYEREHSQFRLWSPVAVSVELRMFKTGGSDGCTAAYEMYKNDDGVWSVTVDGDLHTTYYTYFITYEGYTVETHDPYAIACGVNGCRSMVVDLERTNPAGFETDKSPVYESNTDISVMEISIADTTGDVSSGVKNKGKFIGLTESGTHNEEGRMTGFDHIKSMGISHVQLMPVYDFASIDEAGDLSKQYNWGYDPFNYNCLEGSYSTDPFHGEVRISEFKQMIMKFHSNGIGVIMDVVYNHVFDVWASSLQKTNPNYYFRICNGEYSNASGCGNEVASEKYMVRKYIIDSLCFWAREYHIDGFRFDLMGVFDIETMNLAADELRKIKPDIILYGEGWTGGLCPLPDNDRALKCNVRNLNGIGAFSDDFRDLVKGNVFNSEGAGFVNGASGMEHGIRSAISCPYWTDSPQKVVNYVSCHDNLTLWDKLNLSAADSSYEDKVKMNKLCCALTFTAQGIPFFLQGEEFQRVKHLEDGSISHNSYNLPLSVNGICYDEASKHLDVIDYYKGMIAFRKKHNALRLRTLDEVRDNLKFIDTEIENFIAYTVRSADEELYVAYNANNFAVTGYLPEGIWDMYIYGNVVGDYVIGKITDKVDVPGISCLVAVRNKG